MDHTQTTTGHEGSPARFTGPSEDERLKVNRLASRAKAGDSRSADALIDYYRPRLKAKIITKVDDPDWADELLAIACVEVLKALIPWDSREGDFLAYCAGSLHCLKYVTRRDYELHEHHRALYDVMQGIRMIRRALPAARPTAREYLTALRRPDGDLDLVLQALAELDGEVQLDRVLEPAEEAGEPGGRASAVAFIPAAEPEADASLPTPRLEDCRAALSPHLRPLFEVRLARVLQDAWTNDAPLPLSVEQALRVLEPYAGRCKSDEDRANYRLDLLLREDQIRRELGDKGLLPCPR